MNTDIVHNSKVKLVVAEFGPKAWAVLLPLYCKIYREKGYWLDWMDEDSKLLFAQDDCKCELSFVDEVVAACVRRGLFSKTVFDMYGVLTSDRIQGNYLEGKKRSKEVVFVEDFIVESDDVTIEGENVNIIPLNVDIITKNVDTGTENKRRRRIKGEGEGDAGGENVHTLDDLEKFKAFQEWIQKHTPRVAKMKEPISVDQYLKLRNKIPREVLSKVLTAMQNRGDLLKKYVSAYLTAINWASRESESTSPESKGTVSSVNEKLKAAGKKTV